MEQISDYLKTPNLVELEAHQFTLKVGAILQFYGEGQCYMGGSYLKISED